MSDQHLTFLPVRLRPFTEWALASGYLDTPPGDGKGKPRDADPGYALHALLTGLFGEQAPRPFCPPPLGQRETRARQDQMALWGYTRRPLEDLRKLAKCGDDRFFAMVDWDAARTKPMPARWPEGVRLRFELRACPVKRRSINRPLVTNAEEDNKRETVVYNEPKGREIDAFQLDAARAVEFGAPVPTRADAYTTWLLKSLEQKQDKPAGARLVELPPRHEDEPKRYDVCVDAYRSVRLLRRPSKDGRKSPQWLTRPDVRFSGTLEVADGEAFNHLLASGVGRHCGFGFGMLLLKPA